VLSRLVFRELDRLRVEAEHARRSRSPDHALAVNVHGDRTAEGLHVLRRRIDVDLARGGIDLAEAAAARIHVEPEVAFRVTGDAVSRSGKVRVSGARDLVILHFTGLRV